MILSKVLLVIGVVLVLISTFFHNKEITNWKKNILDESNNPPLEEKKFNTIGWITFILGGILGLSSFFIN